MAPDIDTLMETLIQDAIGDCRRRDDWMRGLPDAKVRQMVERVLCLLPPRQLRIHRDHVYCAECQSIVEDRAIAVRALQETEGRTRATRMKAAAEKTRETIDA